MISNDTLRPTPTPTGAPIEPPNPLYAYVGAFVDELGRAGLRHVVICPGSRSTPLALAFAANEQRPHAPRLWMHVDERSAAFFALGLAKRSGQVVALLCTSGTAAANFYPAIVEAHLTHIPLLVLTADRPPELRENGAPQTIDQNHLYGSHVKWYQEAALPDATNAALRYIRALACRATASALATPAGPVHLNLPFREPLTPDPADLPPADARDPIAWSGRPAGAPYAHVAQAAPAPLDTATAQRLATRLRQAPRGLIIVGPQTDPALPPAAAALAAALGYPILADPLSGLRFSALSPDAYLASYDAFLRLPRFVEATPPDIIIRLGAMPTAKPLLLYLTRYPHCPQLVVCDPDDWNEPTQLATDILHIAPATFCAQLHTLLTADAPTTPTTPTAPSTWQTRWRQADHTTRATLSSAIAAFDLPFEGRVFSELATIQPAPTTIVVGNSMPIRDCDTFFWPTTTDHPPIRIIGNRGANGIDGVISTALGVAAAQPDERVVLIIGDLSFYHDLNGLLAARLHPLNLTIALINNDGGGIFSFLPQASHPQHFERLFGVPTGLDFTHAAHLYGASFTRAATWDAFRAALRHSLTNDGLHIVELPTDRNRHVAMRRDLWRAVESALDHHNLLRPLPVEAAL